jgi:hypothetical protein
MSRLSHRLQRLARSLWCQKKISADTKISSLRMYQAGKNQFHVCVSLSRILKRYDQTERGKTVNVSALRLCPVHPRRKAAFCFTSDDEMGECWTMRQALCNRCCSCRSKIVLCDATAEINLYLHSKHTHTHTHKGHLAFHTTYIDSS